jgi:hypothetical protein
VSSTTSSLTISFKTHFLLSILREASAWEDLPSITQCFSTLTNCSKGFHSSTSSSGTNTRSSSIRPSVCSRLQRYPPIISSQGCSQISPKRHLKSVINSMSGWEAGRAKVDVTFCILDLEPWSVCLKI